MQIPPQRVRIGPAAICIRPTTDGWSSKIELAEPLGADTLLHGRFGEAHELVSLRRSGHVVAKTGDKHRFKADPGDFHLFDSRSGLRIPDAQARHPS